MESKPIISKLQVYYAVSFFSAAAVIGKSFSLHEQFFPAFVHLIEWNIGRFVMLNVSLCILLLSCKLIIKLIFKEMREYEEDKVWERFYFNLVEFCLTLTIFRVEFNKYVLLNYVLMSICRMFHTISAHRIRHMESQRRLSKFVYSKRFVFLYLLFVIDLCAIYYLSTTMYAHGLDHRILFLTEYIVLLLSSIRAIGRYIIFLSGQLGGPGWEDRRGEVVFYLEVWVDIIASLNYVAFFVLVYFKYGLPFYLMRDLYYSFLRVLQKLNELRRYRKISQDFEERFPNATSEDLREYDTVCNICLQGMEEGKAKKLICGHIFHSECLRNWFTNNQKCPICSQNLLRTKKEKSDGKKQNNNNNPNRRDQNEEEEEQQGEENEEQEQDRRQVHEDLQERIQQLIRSNRMGTPTTPSTPSRGTAFDPRSPLPHLQQGVEREMDDGDEEPIIPNLPFGEEVLDEIVKEGAARDSYVRNLERTMEEYHRNIQRMNFVFYSRFRKLKEEHDLRRMQFEK